MKFKIRAEAKDIKIFIVFAILLFYLVSISVLNISEFVTTATLYGFNPLPVFTAEYFAPTMVFYFAILIMVMVSVKSYFFDREKGFGIKEGKKEEGGYSRWSKDSEIKKELKKIDPKADVTDAAGIPLINNKKEMWVDNSEYHSLIIGSTGSGKTEMIVQPLVKTLSKHGESMIITDPKGEIYEKNANELREKGYNIIVLNFRNPIKGNSWNPLTLPYILYKNHDSDKAIELLDDLALNILYDDSSKNQDPFWEKTSADYFAGLSLALFEDAKEDEININSINLMTTVGEQKIGGSTYIKEYFSDKNPSGAAYTNAASTLMSPVETRGSILAVFKQKIKLFASRENISEMLSYSDFDMKEIGRQKTAVFLVIQDEKKTYHPLLTIFLKQCYETLIDVAQENGGKLPFRTNFILDEFANMPPLKDVTTMITASRSRNIRFNFIIQNFAQLTEVYGKNNGETIKGNCGNIIYLISSELSALEEISKMCGEVKSKEKDKTASTPLVTVSDLQRMKQWETIIIRSRKMPFKTRLSPNWEMVENNMWGKNYEKSGYPERERHQVPVFDIKKYVDDLVKARREKMFGTNESSGSSQRIPDMPYMFGNKEQKQNNANVDDLVKRIDAKIAELEEEERKEKLELDAKNQKTITDTKTNSNKENPELDIDKLLKRIDSRIAELEDETDDKHKSPIKESLISKSPVPENKDIKATLIEEIPKTDQIVSKQSKNKLNKSKLVEEDEFVTDDQFFDDFFNDED